MAVIITSREDHVIDQLAVRHETAEGIDTKMDITVTVHSLIYPLELSINTVEE